MNSQKLPPSFYLQEDVVLVGRELLGKVLFSQIDGQLTGGMIVETESYAGTTDRASHAYGGRFTPRTETLYEQGGISYVYLCYGMHSLLNVVTHKKGIPHAVLIRALKPLYGIETMLARRKKKSCSSSLCAGPALLTQALGIDRRHNGLSLQGPILWLENYEQVEEKAIIASPRIGVDYAKEDALLPYRFRIKDSPYTSPA